MLFIIIGIMVVLGILFFVVDYNRVQKQEKPIFCIQNPAGIISDGGTTEYFGLGYKIIDFHTLAGYDDIKIGSWLMDYNDFDAEMKVYEMKFEEELQKNENIINWNEITSMGVDEQKLIENVDVDTLERIATLFQELTEEIGEKEKEDSQFVLSAGWYNYTLESRQFNEVLNIGNNALKPLYLIIYKSPSAGLYEYICSMALEKISKVEIDNWNNSKDFLEKFNKEVVNSKEI